MNNIDRECNHNKVYEKIILTTNPPQQRWICSICKEEGIEIREYKSDNYEDLIIRKSLKNVIVASKGNISFIN